MNGGHSMYDELHDLVDMDLKEFEDDWTETNGLAEEYDSENPGEW